MDRPMISVIVPVYNVEKYLHRCVDSILAQTFKETEIILVDDGSTDSSGAICDSYLEIDSRIRVIHKKNGGLSDARNVGIDSSRGDFLCFVDSDDFIAPEMLDTLYRLIKENDADFSVCGICDSSVNGDTPQSAEESESVMSGVDALKLTLEGKKLPGSMCSKLIPKELCCEHYFIKGKTYEDAFYTPELFLRAKRVAITTKSLYCYWHRENSITTSPFSACSFDVIDAYTYTLEVVQANCPELTDVAIFRLFWAYFVVLDKMLMTKAYRKLPQYKQVVSYLKKHWWMIFCCKYFTKSRRISAVALKLHIGFYRALAQIHHNTHGVHE